MHAGYPLPKITLRSFARLEHFLKTSSYPFAAAYFIQLREVCQTARALSIQNQKENAITALASELIEMHPAIAASPATAQAESAVTTA
jgi:hypothetical protein